MKIAIALATVLFILSTLTGNAQTLVGVRGGLNYSKINGIGSTGSSYSWEEGYHTGIFILHNIGDKLFFQPELVFTTRGYNYSKTYPKNHVISGDTIQLNQNTKLHYLDLPLVSRLQFRNIFMEVGPQFGYRLSSRSYNEHILNKNGEIIYLRANLDSRSSMEPLDIGFILGLGYQTQKGLGVSFRYNQGFREVVKRVNWQKNVLLQLSMSYIWGYETYVRAEKAKLTKAAENQYFDSAKTQATKTKSYRITTSQNIPRISIMKVGDAVRSQIQVVFNSIGIHTLKDVMISGSSGIEEHTNLFIGYRDFEVPFKGTIKYKVAVESGANSIESYFEFEINEPGIWRIQIQTQ